MSALHDLARLAPIVAARQDAGERAVFTNGCFDLLHLGHVAYLRAARDLGDFLIVALNSDASTQRIKGPLRPLVAENARAEILAALSCVDYVTIFDDNTAERAVAALRPAVYVKGGDYAGGEHAQAGVTLAPDELRRLLSGDATAHPALAGLERRLPEARVVAAYGGSIALLPYLPGHSTTELIERIVSRYAKRDAAAPEPRDA
jgi:D-beta-D-heptose 7-phosphate kinase/D-beta-D-heptose 1-phosphate adenosyltransferase